MSPMGDRAVLRASHGVGLRAHLPSAAQRAHDGGSARAGRRVVTSPWDPQTEIPHRGQADTQVTLVEGTSFVVSSRSGDILPGTPQGLFVLDTRIMSTFELLIDG